MNDRQVIHSSVTEHEFTDVIEAPIERRLLKFITYFITISIALWLVWSVFTTIEEIAKAQGSIVPLGHRQVIQSKLGGTIKSVAVKEGEIVKKGQVLVNFEATNSKSAVSGLRSEQASLKLKLERIEAFINHRTADFSAYATKYPKLVFHNQRGLADMNRELNALKQLSKSEIAKSQAEYTSIKRLIPILRKQVESSEQTVEMMEQLVKTGAVSKVKRLEEIQKHDSHIRELQELRGKKDVLLQTLKNVKDQFVKNEATLMKNIGEAETEVQANLLKVEAQLVASNSTVLENIITSPVNGIVQSIPTTNEGGVIPQGGTVAVIVPTTKTALLEAKISPKDIGFVVIGEPARVKVDAYDYSRFGALNGVVESISPTTDADQKGGVFYKVRISIKKPYFGDDPEKFNLIPGMTGEANIVTGQKTVFQYLWKPVFTNVMNAFGER